MLDLETLLEKIKSTPLHVAVFGEFSSGKTTFLNALLGDELLSVSLEPTTAVPTFIRYGRAFNLHVEKKDGTRLSYFNSTPPFWVGETQVTQAQWQAVMGNNPSSDKGQNKPVTDVSWDDCMKFCEKLTESEGKAGRLEEGYVYSLPTEAEWEYACRAGTTGDYAGDLESIAWYDMNSDDKTHDVATKQPNAWGVYDMHGNVFEWCLDGYDANYYSSSPSNNPTGPTSASYRVLRGGGFGSTASFARSAFRNGNSPPYRYSYFGLRLSLRLK